MAKTEATMTPAASPPGGERRVFEGVVRLGEFEGEPWGEVVVPLPRITEAEWATFHPPAVLAGLNGKRVRITFEVLDDAAGESLPGEGGEHA